MTRKESYEIIIQYLHNNIKNMGKNIILDHIDSRISRTKIERAVEEKYGKMDRKKIRESLETVEITEDLECIDSSTFEKCENLLTLIPYNYEDRFLRGKESHHDEYTNFAEFENLETINDNAFNSCSKLNFWGGLVRFPKKLKEIGYKAFADCKKIECVDLSNSNSALTIGEGAFRDCNIHTAYFPNGITCLPSDLFIGNPVCSCLLSSSSALFNRRNVMEPSMRFQWEPYS